VTLQVEMKDLAEAEFRWADLLAPPPLLPKEEEVGNENTTDTCLALGMIWEVYCSDLAVAQLACMLPSHFFAAQCGVHHNVLFNCGSCIFEASA
jgi:hypothetical protein